MRDIMRDAAIITVAKQVMTDDGWMSVNTFLETYSRKGKERDELIAALSLFGLIWQFYQKSRWELEGRYIWLWIDEIAPND